jgi:aspartate racemase
VHTHSLADYMACIYRNDWQGVAELMLAAAEKLASIGARADSDHTGPYPAATK